LNGEDLSDEQLMLMFRYGNRAAFELLFEKHRGVVYNFALRMTGDRHAAEDICQESFLRVVGAAATYEPTARFRTWLFRIVRNCCVDGFRQANVAARHARKAYRMPDVPAPESAVGAKEAAERLEVAVGALPVDQREAFLLRFRQDMSYTEIAEVTGRSLGAVKSHIHRARLRLAEAMKDWLEMEL